MTIIKWTAFITLLFVIVGSQIWIKLNLPYQGNLANAELYRVQRIDFLDRDVSSINSGERQILGSIYDLQMNCHNLGERHLMCDHEIMNKVLTVDVKLSENTNIVIYDCSATYDGVAIKCQAFESIYENGGLATPVVIIGDDISMTATELSNLGLSYKWYSPFNLKLWLRVAYNLLAFLLFIIAASWIWQYLTIDMIPKAFVTAVTSVCAGFIIYGATLFSMLKLWLVS